MKTSFMLVESRFQNHCPFFLIPPTTNSSIEVNILLVLNYVNPTSGGTKSLVNCYWWRRWRSVALMSLLRRCNFYSKPPKYLRITNWVKEKKDIDKHLLNSVFKNWKEKPRNVLENWVCFVHWVSCTPKKEYFKVGLVNSANTEDNWVE